MGANARILLAPGQLVMSVSLVQNVCGSWPAVVLPASCHACTLVAMRDATHARYLGLSGMLSCRPQNRQ